MRRIFAAVMAVLALTAIPARAQRIETTLSTDARVAFERAAKAVVTSDRQAAVREAERLIELAPNYPPAYDVLRAATLSKEELASRAASFKALAEASPSQPALWYAYGRFATSAAESAQAYTRVVELAPDAPWGYVGLARIALAARDLDKARSLLEKASTLAPHEPVVMLGLVVTLFQITGREKEALAALDQLLTAAPENPAAEMALRYAIYAAPSQSRRQLAERYVSLFPSGSYAARARETILDEIGKTDPAAALARAREYLRTGADGMRSGWILMLTHAIEGQGREAADRLAREVASWNETDPFVWMNLVYLYRDEPDYAERAESFYAKAMKLAEALTENRERMVSLVEQQRDEFRISELSRTDPVAAGARAHELMAKRPPEDRSRLFPFVLMGAEKQGPKAIEALAKQMLAEREVDPRDLEQLAYRYDLDACDIDIGLQLISRALDRYAAQPPRMRVPEGLARLQMRLGDAQLRKGDVDASIATIHTIDPVLMDDQAYQLLGRAYARKGDRASALDALVHAVAAWPTRETREAMLAAAKEAGKSADDAENLVVRAREASAYPAPDFTLDVLGGGRVTLSELRGKVVLVNFWFPGCGPCREELPQLQKLYESLKERGLDVLAIDMTSEDPQAAAFWKSAGITFRSLTGDTDDVTDAYETRSAPTTFVVDRQGRVVFVSRSYKADDTVEMLRSIVEPLLVQK